MRKIIGVFLAVAVAVGMAESTAYAQRGGSSSSSSSSGRSFSSGSSSSSSGRSYSSGSSSSSGSRSYSSGSTQSRASGSSSGSSSGKSFSSGSSGSSSKPAASSSGSSSSGRSYSSGSSGSSSSASTSIKPGKSNFDSLGAKEQMKVESRAQYAKGNAPKTEYKAPDGKTATIDPKDAKIERLRGQLDQQKWVNREMRQQQFYGAYYSRPVVIFHDPYPSYFWWWLLDRSAEERALWAYHHRTDMDPARYRELTNKDKELEARIRALEAQKVARDPGYAPKGMDPDLMYDNNYVDAVYNPAATHHDGGESSVTGWGVLKFILICLGICVVIAVIWAVFFNRAY